MDYLIVFYEMKQTELPSSYRIIYFIEEDRNIQRLHAFGNRQSESGFLYESLDKPS